MNNPRGAGRKPKLTDKQFQELKRRWAAGESLTSLSESFGLSRQAIYQRLRKETEQPEIRIDYLNGGELVSSIYANPQTKLIRVLNYVDRLSETAFGWNMNPLWSDLESFLETEFLKQKMPGSCDPLLSDFLFWETPIKKITLSDLKEVETIRIQPGGNLPSFEFTRKNILFTRTDTDGFQMKALSQDRKWFIKSQAIFAGKAMNDWLVEVIASDLCRQLEIPHVVQIPCRIFYNGRRYMGVCSRNFELDGYTFISFERLLECMGKSSREETFRHLNAIEKMQWCAQQLSTAGSLPPAQTKKYMLDLAVIDCLIGNTDRHTKNFGLFYSARRGQYELPLIFDNGMGLFEHDYYNDSYNSFDDAMRTVYIEPYGEDPLDFLEYLLKTFDLYTLYPGLTSLQYPDYPLLPQAKEYQKRVLKILSSFRRKDNNG